MSDDGRRGPFPCRCDLWNYSPHYDPGCPLRVEPFESWRNVARGVRHHLREAVRCVGEQRRAAVRHRRARRKLEERA